MPRTSLNHRVQQCRGRRRRWRSHPGPCALRGGLGRVGGSGRRRRCRRRRRGGAAAARPPPAASPQIGARARVGWWHGSSGRGGAHRVVAAADDTTVAVPVKFIPPEPGDGDATLPSANWPTVGVVESTPTPRLARCAHMAAMAPTATSTANTAADTPPIMTPTFTPPPQRF